MQSEEFFSEEENNFRHARSIKQILKQESNDQLRKMFGDQLERNKQSSSVMPSSSDERMSPSMLDDSMSHAELSDQEPQI